MILLLFFLAGRKISLASLPRLLQTLLDSGLTDLEDPLLSILSLSVGPVMLSPRVSRCTYAYAMSGAIVGAQTDLEGHSNLNNQLLLLYTQEDIRSYFRVRPLISIDAGTGTHSITHASEFVLITGDFSGERRNVCGCMN